MIPHIGTPLPDRADRDWVTAQELAAEAGLTWWQVDIFRRIGDLTMTDGRFAVDQIRRARLLNDLICAGLRVDESRRLLDDLLTHGHARLGHLTLTLDQGDGSDDGPGAA